MLKLCKSVWLIDMFVIHFNPHLEALIRFYILEVLRVKEHTSTLYSFVIFTFEFVVEFV
jgi:hypothetical protein